MGFFESLAHKREDILEGWFDAVVSTYPGLSAVFLKKSHRFGNPVGVNISAALDRLMNELAAPRFSDQAPVAVDAVMRIRAVQEFTPAQAAAVFFALKPVVHRVLAQDIAAPGGLDDLWTLESRIDALALLALDVYTRCREQVFEMRLADYKQRFSGLMRRLDITCELPGAPGSDEESSSANLKRGNGQ